MLLWEGMKIASVSSNDLHEWEKHAHLWRDHVNENLVEHQFSSRSVRYLNEVLLLTVHR